MKTSAATLIAPSRSRVWMSFALAAMLLMSLFSSAMGVRTASAQDTQQNLASVVPADTVMFMTMNLNQESPQWELAYSLFERAGLNDLAESEAGASTEEIGQMAEANNFTGSAAIVFTSAEALISYSGTSVSSTAMDTMNDMEVDPESIPDEVPEGFAMVMQPDDPAALSASFTEMVNEEASTDGATVETVDYNGVTITYFEPSDPAMAGTATAEVDGTVILATRVSDVEPIIDAAQGTTETLASTDGFTAVSSTVQAENIFFGYVNTDAMLTAMESDPSFDELSAETGIPVDFDGGKGHVGFVMYASEGGFHFDSVTIPNDPAMVPDASVTPALASKLPADLMLGYVANNFYGTGVSDLLGVFLQTAMAESAAADGAATPAATPTVEETWAMFEAQLGFNPDTDLLAKLDGDYAVYAGVYDLESGMPSPEFLFISESSDPATLESTTATITDLVTQMNEGDYEVSSRTVDGGEVSVVTLSAESTGGIPVDIEFGVVNGELLIGVNGAIDRYLDASGPKLADDANFQKTMELLPTENVVNVSYVNIQGQVLPFLDWLTMMLGSSTATLDNHEDCGNYATQQEAQAAYDADPGNLWLLDMDYDGEACEDFFGGSTPAASPAPIAEQVNILSAGSVTWVGDGSIHTSSVLVIGD